MTDAREQISREGIEDGAPILHIQCAGCLTNNYHRAVVGNIDHQAMRAGGWRLVPGFGWLCDQCVHLVRLPTFSVV